MQNKSLLVVLFELFVGLLGSLNCRENRFKTKNKKQNKTKPKKKKKTPTPPRKLNKTVTKLWAIGSY